jgi:hypothetical protein
MNICWTGPLRIQTYIDNCISRDLVLEGSMARERDAVYLVSHLQWNEQPTKAAHVLYVGGNTGSSSPKRVSEPRRDTRAVKRHTNGTNPLERQRRLPRVGNPPEMAQTLPRRLAAGFFRRPDAAWIALASQSTQSSRRRVIGRIRRHVAQGFRSNIPASASQAYRSHRVHTTTGAEARYLKKVRREREEKNKHRCSTVFRA